jgi:hypothetical protein
MRFASVLGTLALVGSALSLPACTSRQSNNEASSYLIVEAIEAASGAEPTKFVGALGSDVLTKNSVFTDPGQVTLRLGLVDPGGPGNPSVPTSANFITVNRYHVRYVRTDGHNTPGVDVPAEFDATATLTIGAAPGTLAITLVRAQAKLASPLTGLVGTNNFIPTLCEVTIYGIDQAGRAVSVVASISVDFADWADPS